MEKMTTDELKRKFYCAKHDREMWQTAYMNELENAKGYFLSKHYERASELLKSAQTWLELSASAREEMDAYEKELIRRRCSY